ncbi:hypothetical protein RB195_016339 [Necator americanus]|uniref:Beta-galactosidase n=1 Tax=Necator americanus TaxID=51031 RepID=A0ABR1EAL7_NECAM
MVVLLSPQCDSDVKHALTKLLRIRALGLNAIQYYIPWNFHEVIEGKYDFSGWRNFSEFSLIGYDLGLYTLLRIGPYACGEWENGGFPWWLLNKKNCQPRTSEKGFLNAVKKWFSVLIPVIKPLMRENGGPVLMLQIENEYGSCSYCDRVYTKWLRDFVRSYLGNNIVIYTTDGGSKSYLKCGVVPDTLPTVDFGPTSDENVKAAFEAQRKYLPNGHGPLVNSEFYPGWFVLWGQKSARIPSAEAIVNSAKYMYGLGASINFYMIHGGTNFGFWNGATVKAPVITSYDYFAPISEDGDINEKYLAIRTWIKSIPDWTNKPFDVPENNPKTSYGDVEMFPLQNLFNSPDDICETSQDPKSFEQLGQPFGFVSYSKRIDECGKTLGIKQLKDFGYVLINTNYTGTLMNSYYDKAIRSVNLEHCRVGDILSILVENTGRLTSGTADDRKGILSEVTLDDKILKGWKQCKILFPNADEVKLREQEKPLDDIFLLNTSILYEMAQIIVFQRLLGRIGLYFGSFNADVATDTFLNTKGWGKGIAILNDNNLGRYWASEGPQYTLYIPAAFVRVGINSLMLLELEGTTTCGQESCRVSLVDHPVFVFDEITTHGDFFERN